MSMLTNADQLIDTAKGCGLANITWGGEQDMLCGTRSTTFRWSRSLAVT
jgi:hypothetical protein